MKLNRITFDHIKISPHVYRQIFGTTASSLQFLSAGTVFGYTAVLLPQLKNDKEFPYDETYDSWIAAISPLAMTIASIFSGSLSDVLGRKKGQMLLTLPYVIAWVIMGCSSNNMMILIGRFITGICVGSNRSFSMVYIGEIVDPKYRSIALYVSSPALYVGVLFSHTVGKYVHWKTSCFLFTIPNIISLIILLFLKESPLWLLLKGRIDEGKDSFLSFRGNTESAEKEFNLVLQCNEGTEISFRDILKLFLSKAAMKSFLTVSLMFVTVQWCGVNTISFYAQDIFEKTLSGDVDTFLLLIVIDCIRFTACLINCLFGKILTRNFKFTTSCLMSIVALLVLIVYLYLRPTGVAWVAIACFIVYFSFATILTSISWTYVVELFPAQFRGFATGLISALSYSLLFISVKVTPGIMMKYGLIAMYAGFAVVTLVTSICVFFTLPDTNGKSLQDIENTLYKTKRVNECNLEEVNAK